MRWYLKIISPVLLLVAWEIAAIAVNNEFILPRVGSVFVVLLQPTKDILGSGSLLDNAIISLTRVVSGFLLGIVVAIPIGIGMGRVRWINDMVDPVIELIRPIPPIAWIPLALAWFKIGLASILFIIFIGSFFPVLLNTIDGVRRVNRTWIETAYMYGAKELQLLVKVIIPAAAPTIWTGIRVGFGIAWMSVVAAEMLPGTTSGLGYLIMYSYNFGQVQVIIAGMIVIGIIGLGIDIFLKEVERRKFRWQGLER
ncbi:MAG: ABC transporter permease [Methanoregula sp.]|jgi:NitT/TauT family transport system permease protein|nr:ABC transporter permease [Methanoregula sp.]MDD5024018.1 ABC transporter permease [Methanoregula sp.]MDD5186728.1 ABC transporter permease [Methanoregula sp.]